MEGAPVMPHARRLGRHSWPALPSYRIEKARAAPRQAMPTTTQVT
jgi:hypothetical protein